MDELARPKLYLFVCVLALFAEVMFMLVRAPLPCSRCHMPMDIVGQATPERPRSKILPEFCEPCVNEIRELLTSGDSNDPVVSLDTTLGEIVIELFPKKAPKSVANFLAYARAGNYDGVIFHRIESYLCVTGRYRNDYATLPVIPQFGPIQSESNNGLSNKRGTVSLPRQNESTDSATSDFFFNLQDNPNYDWRGSTPELAGYAVFGRVTRGYELLDRTKALPVIEKAPFPGFERLPRVPIVIKHVTIVHE